MSIQDLHDIFINSNGVCTDTRKLNNGDLFFALKGDNFNGNKYAIKAIENGAGYAVIDDTTIKHENCILVNDVLKTLQDLAKYHRLKLNTTIIGLTGSNGKTTTKELINAVLKTSYKTSATKGNLNNHIGVPLSLLDIEESTEIGIIEMGANHLKEIELLSSLSTPNYGYITNIGKAHLEGFGSEENILIGKTELYKNIQNNKGSVFLNNEDKKLVHASKELDTITFSNNHTQSEYQIEFISANPFVKVKYQNTEIKSNLIGSYNYTNIAASITIGLHLKVSIENIKKAIENYVPKINRSELLEKGSNTIILDAYNANPTSMKAAIENFENTTSKKNKIAILGDMFELGDYSEKEHQEIVNLLNENTSIKKIYLTGNHFHKSIAKDEHFSKFKTTENLLDDLKKEKITESYILIKGSRGMALEQATQYL